jgi:hypothetical protein
VPEPTDTKPEEQPINPASTREQLRSWLQWLPAWLLLPLGLGPSTTETSADGMATDYQGGYEGGYGGPLDSPGHIDSGYGDGASDLGGGLSGF